MAKDLPAEPVGELSHFQRLDIEQLKLEHEHRVVETKAKYDAETIKRRAELEAIRAKHQARKFWRWVSAVVLGIAVILGGISAAISVAHSGPAKSVEQIKLEQKQKRFEACIRDEDFGGQPTQVWYPEANHGEGQCLPKGAPAPTS